jgi:Spy/CpxP family protein refolding chaperone
MEVFMKTRTMFRAAVAAAVMLAASLCMAQGFGGMMMMGRSNTLALLQRDDVQTDLALTGDQKSKLQTLLQNLQDKRREIMQEARDNGGDFNSVRDQLTKLQDGAEKQANEILTPAQQKRVKEIGIQVDGNRSILRAEIQKDLGITDEQKKKIADIQAKSQADMQAYFEGLRNSGSFDRDAIQAEMKKRNDKLSEELGKVLTAEQAKKLKEMGGKEFKQKTGVGG